MRPITPARWRLIMGNTKKLDDTQEISLDDMNLSEDILEEEALELLDEDDESAETIEVTKTMQISLAQHDVTKTQHISLPTEDSTGEFDLSSDALETLEEPNAEALIEVEIESIPELEAVPAISADLELAEKEIEVQEEGHTEEEISLLEEVVEEMSLAEEPVEKSVAEDVAEVVVEEEAEEEEKESEEAITPMMQALLQKAGGSSPEHEEIAETEEEIEESAAPVFQEIPRPTSHLRVVKERAQEEEPLFKKTEHDEFWLLHYGQKEGPFTVAEIEEKLSQKQILFTDLISPNMGATWIKIYRHECFNRRVSTEEEKTPELPFKPADNIFKQAHLVRDIELEEEAEAIADFAINKNQSRQYQEEDEDEEELNAQMPSRKRFWSIAAALSCVLAFITWMKFSPATPGDAQLAARRPASVSTLDENSKLTPSQKVPSREAFRKRKSISRPISNPAIEQRSKVKRPELSKTTGRRTRLTKPSAPAKKMARIAKKPDAQYRNDQPAPAENSWDDVIERDREPAAFNENELLDEIDNEIEEELEQIEGNDSLPEEAKDMLTE